MRKNTKRERERQKTGNEVKRNGLTSKVELRKIYPFLVALFAHDFNTDLLKQLLFEWFLGC